MRGTSRWLWTAGHLEHHLLEESDIVRSIDFKKASDRAAAARITLADMAKSFGIGHQTLRRARLDPESGSYREPPEGWEKALAKLAQKRASDLIKLAEELRRAAERK